MLTGRGDEQTRSRGRLVKISKGAKIEHDPKQVVVLLRGSLYNDACGSLPAPLVVTFKTSDAVSASGEKNELEKKLASRKLAMKFGKNGLGAHRLKTSQNSKRTKPQKAPTWTTTRPSLSRARAMYSSTSSLPISPWSSGRVFVAFGATRKETLLKSFTKKMSRMDTAPRSPRQNAELDLETGAGSCASPRSPGRHLSMIGAPDTRRTIRDSSPTGAADLSEDDQTQRTFLSSGSADYGTRTPNRSLTSRNYEDPSTQSTIS